MRSGLGVAIVTSLGMALPFEAVAAPMATLRWNGDWDGKVPFRGCQIPGDSMTLTIREGRRVVAERDICPAYNQAKARVVSDAKGVNYLLLETSEGHGTHVMQTYLEVYRLPELWTYAARTPIYGPSGILREWRYSYVVTKPRGGGLRLVLRRRMAGAVRPGDAPAPEPRRVITIETGR
jgi:hypothetical protein